MIKFGTGGFRGVIADDFTKENVQKIAQGLSLTALENGWGGKPVVIGYDLRFMSDKFAAWMAEVFAGNGIKVLLCTSVVPTPIVMSATKDMDNELGVMITASHNPYVFNGVKVFRKNGMDADVGFTNALENVTNACGNVNVMPLALAKERGLVEEYSHIEKYLDNIVSFIDPKIKFNKAKILFDNMCGAGCVGLKPIARRLNITRFDIINEKHDAFFNFITPNPTEEAMSRLKNMVVKNGYDYAIATDSDADRLGVLDENGNSVSSNEILACLYYYLVRYRGQKGDIVKNCSASVLLDMLAEKLGFKCYEVDVGFKNISAKLKETNALIGGESSGGLTVRNYIFGKDSTFSAALFMEMQIVMNKPVSEIVGEVKNFAGYGYYCAEDSCEVSDMRVFDALYKDDGREIGAKKVHAFNRNVKYYFENGCWALLRASGTEPLLRIAAEMPSESEVRKIAEKLKCKIKETDDKLLKGSL